MLFVGRRTPKGAEVTVDGEPLPLYLEEINHSPTGAEWGYGGSGPAQLAYALLRHTFGRGIALEFYQDAKDWIAQWPQQGWNLGSHDLGEWLLSSKERAWRLLRLAQEPCQVLCEPLEDCPCWRKGVDDGRLEALRDD